jgi:hypothetical protein
MVKNMKNEVNKNMELMKKVIEEKKAKSSKQKNTKRAPIYGPQSPMSGGQGLFGK